MQRPSKLQEMAEKFAKRFPDKTLLEYTNSRSPCKILCPVHGEQVSASYTSIYNSKHGCPECGKAATKEAVKLTTAAYHAKNREKLQTLKTAESVVGTQNVESVIAAGMAALNAAKNGQLPFESNLTMNTGIFETWSKPEDLDPDSYVFIPYYKDIKLAAGGGRINSDDTTEPFRLPFGRATLRRKGIMVDNAVCCTVEGDSMDPVLPDGTTVGVDTAATTIRDGKMYAIDQGGLSRIKLLSREPNNQVRIRSYNMGYQDEVVPLDSIRVIGQVFWWSVLP